MNEMNPLQDDEIDLFELFQTLWDGKWLISAFVAIAVLLGGSFLLIKDAVYESKLIYSVNSIPPFYNAKKASTDFQNQFYSVSVFEEWKQNNINTSLVFEDFSMTEVVDGFVLSKDEDEQLATLTFEKKGVSFVLVKSNQLPIVDDFFNYAIHINRLLKDEYVVRAKEELRIIDARFKDLNSADSNIVDIVLSINRYIVTAEKGSKVFAIQRPSMPEKVSPKSSLTLALSVVLGGMVGVLFILIRNAIAKRKEKLAKA
ncbi:Wzz/FepE/Etk N-terminal domain-containing protein [bacterium]|nr:Wzz/FepE/Etk N-terminal domain-containing protein [bacterium]